MPTDNITDPLQELHEEYIQQVTESGYLSTTWTITGIYER